MPGGSRATFRRCDRCQAARPPDHTYCFACGQLLGPAILPANKQGFRRTGLGLSAPRIATRRDRWPEGRPRTWADTLAQVYVVATLVAAGILAASSRGWLAPGLWPAVRAVLSR